MKFRNVFIPTAPQELFLYRFSVSFYPNNSTRIIFILFLKCFLYQHYKRYFILVLYCFLTNNAANNIFILVLEWFLY